MGAFFRVDDLNYIDEFNWIHNIFCSRYNWSVNSSTAALTNVRACVWTNFVQMIICIESANIPWPFITDTVVPLSTSRIFQIRLISKMWWYLSEFIFRGATFLHNEKKGANESEKNIKVWNNIGTRFDSAICVWVRGLLQCLLFFLRSLTLVT